MTSKREMRAPEATAAASSGCASGLEPSAGVRSSICAWPE